MNQHYSLEDGDHRVTGAQTIGTVQPSGVASARSPDGPGAGGLRSLAAIWRWRQRRLGLCRLQALSDRQLSDIGIDRSQIATVVEEVVRTGRRSTRSGA